MFVDARRSSGEATEARGTLLAEDICVPVDRLPEVLAEITAHRRADTTSRSPSSPTPATATCTPASSTRPATTARATAPGWPSTS